MRNGRALRRETPLFMLAVGVVAINATVDAFLAPERGTVWSDHLLRGSLTLAILAAAAMIYPRLPAGGRAALSAVLGLLALEGAGLAIFDARAAGARGEDWTGFLLGPTSLVLCGLAAVLLWRSRKPGRLRYVRRGGLVLAGALLGLWVVVPVATAILATHRPRADVASVSLARPYRSVTLSTADDLDLAGWYVPSRNGAAVVGFLDRALLAKE